VKKNHAVLASATQKEPPALPQAAKSREETPKEGSDSGVGLGGRYRIPLAKTIAISGSTERKGHGPIRRFMALALKAEHFRNGSFATKLAGPACHSMFALHRKAT
jgi:hypothetical protein